MEKLKILQLVPRFPFPLDDGGKIGIANIYKEFSHQGNEVFLFSLGDEPISKKDIDEAKKFGIVSIFKHNTANTLPRILKSFLTNRSIYLEKHINEKIKSELRNILSSEKFNIIHADHTCMAPLAFYVKTLLDIPVGLRLHNIEWTIWQKYADELKNPIKRFYIQQQANLLKKAEQLIINKADINFAITDKDRERALELSPGANLVIASAGVNTDEWCPEESIERNPTELVLATTFRWIHNVNAVEWFIKEVMPILKIQIPEIKLTLIGKNPPEWLGNYKESGVNPVGYVDKVQPYYNRASINISPLFVGGGIRIKILEAMSMGLPVVASPIAAEGINAGQSEGLFLADSKNEFANHIIYLINNPNLLSDLRNSTRNYIESNYSWKKNVAVMIDNYEKLLHIKK